MSRNPQTGGPSEELACACAELREGLAHAAAQRLTALAAREPAWPEAKYWLHSALAAAGQREGAAQALNDANNLLAVQVMKAQAVDLPRLVADASYAAEIGKRAYARKWPAVASVALGRALGLGETTSELLLSYGLALQHQGRAEEAIMVFRALIEVAPSPQAHQFLLFALFFGEDGVHRYAAEARRWAKLYAPGGTEPMSPEPAPGRRRRIGYVAPNFSRSQLWQFIRPVLEAHDRESVEVFLYTASVAKEDPLPADHIVEIGQFSNDDAAARIRADRIDVLVDLWGHTVGSRLPVFALRAAPVQVAWVNFVQTTGLSCMDYVLHADSMGAPGTDALFTEAVWRMGEITIPYRPAFDLPEPTPPPAIKTGRVTFGSFNNPVKLNDQTVAAWARILRGREGSRLLLKYSYFHDPVLQRATRARFAAHGVELERIEFQGHSTGPEYLAAYAEVDLALDPSPCPGGTTTCDALAAGVPVLTLAGDNFYARIGIQGVGTCGLPELVATSWDEYVARALEVTADFDRLSALRARVRPGFEASPLRDEVGFTRRLEAAFCEMVARRLSKAA